MRSFLIALLGLALLATSANATVFINEVMFNPPGSGDDDYEFIELLGTPGRKLDGYAIALANGTTRKYWMIGTPYPGDQEFDEFFSLDGLKLGPNGMLVLGVSIQGNFPTVLPDTNFRKWKNPNGIWNGGQDTPGKLQNDGSNTVFLIRNRPGATEANPGRAPGLRWGKDISHDTEYTTGVEDPQDPPPPYYDVWGDGNIDRGGPDGLGGFTWDLKGATTPELTDDLEVVDEVSYEHERGWEYDLDGRHVDLDSNKPWAPYRHVHALDDPQGFNPDSLTRVDYRTKGDGWAPVSGATGEMLNGNNWQDTATEQWIRGEVVQSNGPMGPEFYYDNDPNANANPDVDPNQQYVTNVPLWLNDGAAPDYDFTVLMSYQIAPGRLNTFATPFIPGDTDRDGDCDTDDIAKLAAVYHEGGLDPNTGEWRWVFSNSYSEAPETDEGDPAAQTRPWDVDLTGDNGVEPSDLQWVLNFQGSTDGRLVGVTYDSETPSATGVTLNPNTGVTCDVTTVVSVPSGHALDSLVAGEHVVIDVYAEHTGTTYTGSGVENGIMQFAHDVIIDTPGVVQVASIEPLGVFDITRADSVTFLGTDGDEGAALVNGYTTDFTQGLTGPTPLYRVRLRAIGDGDASVTIAATAAARVSISTPTGLKVGHTDSNGDPTAVTYPGTVNVTAAGEWLPGDADCDRTVGYFDIEGFLLALNGETGYTQEYPSCNWYNLDCNGDGSIGYFDINPFLDLLGTTYP